MTRQARTFCRICAAQCGMLLDVDDSVAGGRIVGVHGDPSHPFTKGYLCAKGRAIGDAHHGANRLTGAWVGRGADRRVTSIDDCHGDLAGALLRIIEQDGTGAIGVFHGTGAFSDALATFTSRRFKRSLATNQLYSTATVDAVAKTLVASEMGGTPLLVPQIDEEAGRLLIFVGINPVVSHGHATMFSNPVERIRAARARGPVFTLDPRTTETAKLSDHHLALRPATDYAVFAHLIRELLGAGDVDLESLAEGAVGIAELTALVEPFDQASVVSITGLRRCELATLLDEVRRAGRLAVLSGTGSTMNPTANFGEWMAWALMVVTDSFDRPGGMWFNPGLFSRLDRFETLPRAAAAEPRSAARPDIARCGGEWPAALIPDEIEAGRLRALVVMGANLITALPDPARVAAALAAIEVLVVIDVVHNDTSDLATHVFAGAGQLERPVTSRLPSGAWQLAPPRLVAQFADFQAAPAPSVGGLVLIPRRLVRRMNWQRFREGDEPDVLIHPDDAAAVGVCDGERVEVSTDLGAVTLIARVTGSVVAGAVSIVHGFPDANVNSLLDRHSLDPLSGMAHLAAVPVKVRPLGRR